MLPVCLSHAINGRTKQLDEFWWFQHFARGAIAQEYLPRLPEVRNGCRHCRAPVIVVGNLGVGEIGAHIAASSNGWYQLVAQAIAAWFDAFSRQYGMQDLRCSRHNAVNAIGDNSGDYCCRVAWCDIEHGCIQIGMALGTKVDVVWSHTVVRMRLIVRIAAIEKR